MDKIKELVKGATEMTAAKETKRQENVDNAIDKVVNSTSKVPEAKIKVIIAQLPETVTPKALAELFQFDDGGKTMRRHLRKAFADKHEHKSDWSWKKNDPVLKSIVVYFAERYSPAVKEDKKTEAK